MVVWSIKLYEEALEWVRAAEQSAATAASASFVLQSGSLPIMLSAPHNVEHVREGVTKYAEPETGPLAYAIGRMYDCPFIIQVRNDSLDPNWDEQSAYRDAVYAYVVENGVRFLLDLHQLSPKREQDIILGTGKGDNIVGWDHLVPKIKAAFNGHGLANVAVDEVFSATYPHTVSASTAREAHIPCFQVEMNSALFMPENPRYNPLAVCEALSDIVSLLGRLS